MAVYSDLRADYGEASIPGKQMVVPDEQAIRESVMNILTTGPNERFMRPDFYSEIYLWLFEPMSISIGTEILYSVKKTLLKWEPRVVLNLNRSSIVVNYEEYMYEMSLFLEIPSLARSAGPTGITLDYNLKAG